MRKHFSSSTQVSVCLSGYKLGCWAIDVQKAQPDAHCTSSTCASLKLAVDSLGPVHPFLEALLVILSPVQLQMPLHLCRSHFLLQTVPRPKHVGAASSSGAAGAGNGFQADFKEEVATAPDFTGGTTPGEDELGLQNASPSQSFRGGLDPNDPKQRARAAQKRFRTRQKVR